MPPAPLLAHDLVRILGTRRVLDGVSLVAAPGQRIALIGENGVGKSTLLRLLAGIDQPDSGTVVRPVDLGYLHQQLPFEPATTIADVLDDALRAARETLARLDRLTGALGDAAPDSPGYAGLLAEYGRELDHARDHEVWDADRRAETMLAGLGLGRLPHDRTLASLSGGQRGRLALAALLVRRPTALLLDEPTNHLDDPAAAFLEEQLRTLPGIVVAASHDRAFLDAVCTDLIDLDPAVHGPIRFGGDYTGYQAHRRAERDRWQRRFADEQKELAALRAVVASTGERVGRGGVKRDNEKMGYGHAGGRVQNRIARQVRNASRRLDELARDQVREPPEPLRFRPAALAGDPAGSTECTELPGDPTGFTESTELAGDAPEMLLSLRRVTVPGRLRVDRLDVPATDRLLVTGANGAGKSTLLAVLAGHVPALGDLRRRPGLTVAMLAQDTVFARPDRTVRTTYTAALGAARAEAVPLLSLGLIGPHDLDRRVGHLSVGQRRRLALALLVANPPTLLLLDEPTNHLSPRLADELEEALGPGPGAIVVASHDRWLRNRWQGREFHL
ncbi:ABC-F family ATP-binding cassette domain-containing protein [Streptomyces sp. SID3343]|uniref:ABC-F family ATP-binding cassette domain-containing protein n=1 Tax=Streptomyces sp. SID3343 TaxID=2690260 RepID=UPI00136EACB2|nr:ABC-F family ATP-binding cassette domain-containing protein [Streptomyces sp. SID3343]MYV99313.1 ATP-binding cassette domain-containing protein [Streptomyces sp. SID3343]